MTLGDFPGPRTADFIALFLEHFFKKGRDGAQVKGGGAGYTGDVGILELEDRNTGGLDADNPGNALGADLARTADKNEALELGQELGAARTGFLPQWRGRAGAEGWAEPQPPVVIAPRCPGGLCH